MLYMRSQIQGPLSEHRTGSFPWNTLEKHHFLRFNFRMTEPHKIIIRLFSSTETEIRPILTNIDAFNQKSADIKQCCALKLYLLYYL